MTGEDGSCAYLNPENGTISPCGAPLGVLLPSAEGTTGGEPKVAQ